MISAWDIYWVMQLDSINSFLGAAFAAACFAMVMPIVFGAMETDCGHSKYRDNAAEVWRKCKRTSKIASGAAVLLGILWALVPSTRTAAAMVVLPAIANNQAIQKEAGDLYGIAKDALRNLAAPKQEARK